MLHIALAGRVGLETDGAGLDAGGIGRLGRVALAYLVAEGVRGHLSKMLKGRFDLESDCQQQTYGIGIK